ncbi:MAG: SRPBCC domain-containing protein [Pedobacter sp.]|uniref:SRPBCC domain-containing protein n=1 Tax=Pedobacter sp. TaxID=1411316 RepID=UPI002806EAF7|nr:SRPBCC domain-containing protein [Pedobacter sp.]MDQ8004933.1 SRPBCC domain-containing protein [Pedobacter sp.]
MERIYFKIEINASKEKIWDILLGETTYPQWTAVFAEGSRAITDWQPGSKVFFVNAEGDGMASKIAEHIPNEYISIKHLGFYKNGVEDYESEEAKKWGDIYENYKISHLDGKSMLSVEMDITKEYKDYFEEKWPKALEKVKELAEG